jgi:hypothetical protein
VVKRSFRRDQRALAWVLGVAVIAILLMPIVYFPLDYAWDQVYVSIVGDYTFTGSTALAVTVVQFILSYLCAFGLLFVVNWAIVQAKAGRYNP